MHWSRLEERVQWNDGEDMVLGCSIETWHNWEDCPDPLDCHTFS